LQVIAKASAASAAVQPRPACGEKFPTLRSSSGSLSGEKIRCYRSSVEKKSEFRLTDPVTHDALMMNVLAPL
jgi:hypothetical protein